VRGHPRPTVKHKEPKRAYIVPFFTDQVKLDSDLFRFVAPISMDFKSVVIRIDCMNVSSLLLNGGIQAKDSKFALSRPVSVGTNVFEFDYSIKKGDILILNFDDKELASQNVSGITISIYAMQ